MTTILSVMTILVLFTLAVNAYWTGQRNMRQLGHGLVAIAILTVVLAYTGTIDEIWNAYVQTVWVEKL